MKKVCLFILSVALVIGLVLAGNNSVKATTESYIDTAVKTDIPNSTNGSGCFISFYEWIYTADDLYSFLELEFGQNCQNTDFIGRLGEQLIMAQNLGYIDLDLKPCILYISNENLLNKWLRDNMFIEYGATYKDGITGVNNGEYSPVGKDGFHALYQLLKLRGELQAYVLSPEDIPGVFFKANPDADNLTDTWYIFSEIKKPYIINGTWQYKSLEYDCPVEECSVIDLANSVGKVKQVSSNIYEYIYSEVYFNDEFGYYALSQNDTKVMQLSKNQLPSFVFDSNGVLKDVYISKQDNLWTCPEVKDVSKEIEFHWNYGRKNAGSNNGFVYYEIYFNFNLPVDTLESIEFNLPVRKVTKIFNWVMKSEKMTTSLVMTVKKDENVSHLVGSDYEHWYEFFIPSKKELAIQKGSYSVGDNIYDFKILYSDNSYYIFTDDEKKTSWSSVSKNDTVTYFGPSIYPIIDNKKDNLLMATGNYSFKSIMYSFKNLGGIADLNPDDPGKEKSLLEKIWEWICKLWNEGIWGKILVIVLLLPVIFVFCYLLYLIYKLIRFIVKLTKKE